MPTFSNNDTLSQHVAKLNNFDSDVGSRSSLTTTDTTDVVSAINELVTRFENQDSTGVLKIGVSGVGNLDFDSSANVLSYLGPVLGGAGLSYDSATNVLSGTDASTSSKGVASFSSDNFAVSSGAVTIKNGGVVNDEIATDTITSNRFNSVVSLIVYDSSGSSVKSLFSPGS